MPDDRKDLETRVMELKLELISVEDRLTYIEVQEAFALLDKHRSMLTKLGKRRGETILGLLQKLCDELHCVIDPLTTGRRNEEDQLKSARSLMGKG